MPFALVTLGAVLVLFGLVLTPARAVPWPSVARELHYRREQFLFLGLAGLLAIGIFFAFDLSSG